MVVPRPETAEDICLSREVMPRLDRQVVINLGTGRARVGYCSRANHAPTRKADGDCTRSRSRTHHGIQ